MRRMSLYVAVLAALAVAPTFAEPAAPAGAGSKLHVVLIGGLNRDPEEIRSKDRAISRLARHFSGRVASPSQDLAVLAGPDSFVTDPTGVSTAKSVRAAFTRLQAVPENDRVVVYYTGQANIVGKSLRLNLPGPDMTHEELADLLAPVHAGLLVVVLDCPGAGLAAEALAGPNRILLFGARSDQPTSTRFSDYFVPALEDPASDLDGDGTVTLVEVFQHTVQQIDAFFRDQDLLKSENALLEDSGDATPSQQPWANSEQGNDGAAAARIAVETWNVCYTGPGPVQPSQPSNEEGGIAP